MKKRILSFVLAVLMVASMVLVFSVSAFAEEKNFTIVIGNGYASPGEVAVVEILVKADEVPEGEDHLREWQFAFSKTLQITKTGYVMITNDEKGIPQGEINLSKNEAMASVGLGYHYGTADEFETVDGRAIAKVGFVVPDDAKAGDVYVVDIDEIVAFGMEEAGATSSSKPVSEKDNVKVVAGKVVVTGGKTIKADGITDETVEEYGAIVGEYQSIVSAGDDDFVIDTYQGGRIASLYCYFEGQEDDFEFNLIDGFNKRSLYVPAYLTDIIDAIKNAVSFNCETLVIKNPRLGASKKDWKAAINKPENGIGKVYGHVLADGTSSVKSNVGTQATFENLLKVNADVKKVDVDKVAFVAGITFNDLAYESLKFIVTVTPEGGTAKTFTSDVKSVYSTIKGIATTAANAEVTSPAQGVDILDGFAYLTGIQINGITAGNYTATLQVVATIEDADGAPCTVISDPIEAIEFTV